MGSKNHHWLFFILANLLIIASNIPFFLHIVRNPSNSYYPLVHSDFSHDYYLYLSVVEQGKTGFWQYRESYTTEPTHPGFFLFYYILTGKLAALLHLDGPLAYHLVRILSVELFIIFSFKLAEIALGNSHAIWAALFGLIGTISPPFFFQEKIALTQYPAGLPWWMNYDSLERLNGVPHHIFGQAMLLLAIICILKFFHTQKIKYAFGAGFITLIGGFLFPPILPPLAVCLVLSYIPIVAQFAKIYKQMKRTSGYTDRNLNCERHILNLIKIHKNTHLGIIIILSFITIAFAFFFLQEKQGFPWGMWRRWEIVRWNMNEPNFDRQLLLLFGVLPVLSIPALIKIVRSGNINHYFIFFWAIFPFFFLPFVNILGVPKVRILQTAPFIPMGILTVITLFDVFKKNNLFRYLIIILFFFTCLPVSAWLLLSRIQTIDYYIAGPQTHLPISEYEAISFIHKNLPLSLRFLSAQRLGNIIPAFTPVISYIGHLTHTLNFNQKEVYVNRFYSGSLNEIEAYKFLKDNSIQLVYYGTDEKNSGNKPLNYSFLKPIYQKGDIELFKVN